jgi:DNA-binding CsgD family transcriptional regulator
MNNSSRKVVVVISPSDIILTGLSEILKSSQAGEIIQLHKGDEILDYSALAGIILLIAQQEEIEKNGTFVRQILSGAQTIHFIPFLTSEIQKADHPTISLYESPALICHKVNEILTELSNNQQKDADTELTRREIEVLQLVTKGYSNKEIADQLFVSTHTVISHRKNISEKTGIKSASGLTMYAILKKIIDVSDINPDELI